MFSGHASVLMLVAMFFEKYSRNVFLLDQDHSLPYMDPQHAVSAYAHSSITADITGLPADTITTPLSHRSPFRNRRLTVHQVKRRAQLHTLLRLLVWSVTAVGLVLIIACRASYTADVLVGLYVSITSFVLYHTWIEREEDKEDIERSRVAKWLEGDTLAPTMHVPETIDQDAANVYRSGPYEEDDVHRQVRTESHTY